MHECVGASQGYHGVRVRVRVRVSWGGWWVLGVLPRPVGWLVGSWRWGKYGYLPHRCGDSAVPVAAPRQDRLGCTIDPMIALRRANALEDSVGHSTCMDVLARRRAIMGLGL